MKKALIALALCLPISAFAQYYNPDSWHQLPNVPNNGCASGVRLSPAIGDAITGETACTKHDLAGDPYWDISPYEDGNFTYSLAITRSYSATTTVFIAQRYVNLWYKVLGGAPTCSPYIQDASGNIYGQLSDPGLINFYGVASASNFAGYPQSVPGATYYNVLCQYDMGSAATTMVNGMFFGNGASTTISFDNSGGMVVNGGNVTALYSTASSTDYTGFASATEFTAYLREHVDSVTSGNIAITAVSPSDTIFTQCFDDYSYDGLLSGTTYRNFGLALVCSAQRLVGWTVGFLFVPSNEQMDSMVADLTGRATSTTGVTQSLFMIPLRFANYTNSSNNATSTQLSIVIPSSISGGTYTTTTQTLNLNGSGFSTYDTKLASWAGIFLAVFATLYASMLLFKLLH